MLSREAVVWVRIRALRFTDFAMNSLGPIGVFDSGVGGLSVLRAIREELPHEDLIYVADSAHVPYGEKSAGFIEARSLAVAEFLVEQGVKSIVVACNTATNMAVSSIRARWSLPIVGIEPALKPAAEKTRSGIVGVLATTATLASEKFAQLVARQPADVVILAQSCPGLVEQVEAGDLCGALTRELVGKYVGPLLAGGADAIVLGCTHYPFVIELIREIAGREMALFDPSQAVARELRRRLEEAGLLALHGRQGNERFFVSGPLQSAQKSISLLWGKAEIHEMSREVN